MEDSWIWEDGTPWGYTFWGQDEPNGGTSENCLLLDMDEGTQIRGRWIDVACEGRTGRDEGYICSYVNGRSYVVIVIGNRDKGRVYKKAEVMSCTFISSHAIGLRAF